MANDSVLRERLAAQGQAGIGDQQLRLIGRHVVPARDVLDRMVMIVPGARQIVLAPDVMHLGRGHEAFSTVEHEAVAARRGAKAVRPQGLGPQGLLVLAFLPGQRERLFAAGEREKPLPSLAARCSASRTAR